MLDAAPHLPGCAPLDLKLVLTVFRLEESTLVAVEGGFFKGASDDTVRYVAVIKPIAGKKFERTCLLRASGAP